MFKFLKTIFIVEREEWIQNDQLCFDNFVTSALCPSIEKSLRNRIAERSGVILNNVDTQKAKDAKARIEELEDILTEWSNLRSDLQKNQ